jgi:hypothetical protein
MQQKILAIDSGMTTIQAMLRCNMIPMRPYAAQIVPVTYFNSWRITMSALTVEQVVAAQKANIETLFGLTSKAFRRRGKNG